MNKKQCKRIGYDNEEAIAYDVFRKLIPLADSVRQEKMQASVTR